MDQHDAIRKALLHKRQELSRRLDSIKSNLTRGRSADSQEQAQELENAEVVDALGNEARHDSSQNLGEFHGSLRLSLPTLFDSLVQRLQDAGIHRRDDIYRRVQFFFPHACFPCIRKASFYSGIAKAHHRHRQTDGHLFSFRKALDGMGITIESSKIRSF